MTLTVDRPVSAPPRADHEHTRACWWDHTQARWAGPEHPALAGPLVPAPRGPAED